MTALSRSVLALAVLFLSTSAQASETTVYGRKVLRECVYAHAYEAEVQLNYLNYSLPWGTSVELIYGWGGQSNSVPFDWANTQTVSAPASAPYTWSATVRAITGRRTEPHWNYQHVDFVWRVIMPNGYTFYEKGNGSTWGFYSASLETGVIPPCTSDGNFVGPLYPLTFTSIERW
ncbi:hypothetical protein [Pyxidicoccus xibeiensis]|uniref:hypothetical protein n=1 Tax=Pyxidicoccus xibeiensis TaxID=2906759 RepID=UPI0020A73A97|nr:hypothetical protein [Pyxidicoccus xibeiensis]MCP3136594.1 hypothetical protein [Pyxidicoccus xibeiensis]